MVRRNDEGYAKYRNAEIGPITKPSKENNMQITKDEVRHVARLARLALEDDTLDDMAAQIGTILTYMETLNRIDTTAVQPTAHAVSAPITPVREDVTGEHLPRDKALVNAPEEDGESFLVPRVID